MVLRAVRGGARRPITGSRGWELRRAVCVEAAFMTGSRVPMNQSLACGAIEQPDGGQLDIGSRFGGLSLLERRPQGRTLRTVAHGRRARLTHVLLCGCDIRHETISRSARQGGLRETFRTDFPSKNEPRT